VICLAIAGTSSAAITPPLAGKALLIVSRCWRSWSCSPSIAGAARRCCPATPSRPAVARAGDVADPAARRHLQSLQIYVPIFLQRLHGFDPLSAGYAVASASLGWTAAALATAGAQRQCRIG